MPKKSNTSSETAAQQAKASSVKPSAARRKKVKTDPVSEAAPDSLVQSAEVTAPSVARPVVATPEVTVQPAAAKDKSAVRHRKAAVAVAAAVVSVPAAEAAPVQETVPLRETVPVADIVVALTRPEPVAQPEIETPLPSAEHYEQPEYLEHSEQSISNLDWHGEVARLAFSYFEQRGFQGGSPEDDWHRAERELHERLVLVAR
jgi:hypothetical protein